MTFSEQVHFPPRCLVPIAPLRWPLMPRPSTEPLIVVPSIDLRGGRVVRLRQGDYADQLNYDVDPLTTARAFAAAGAEWMHIVDLDGAKEGRPVQTDLVRLTIAASGLKVQT